MTQRWNNNDSNDFHYLILDGRSNNIILLGFPNEGKGATFAFSLPIARLTYNKSEVDLRTPAIAGTSYNDEKKNLDSS